MHDWTIIMDNFICIIPGIDLIPIKYAQFDFSPLITLTLLLVWHFDNRKHGLVNEVYMWYQKMYHQLIFITDYWSKNILRIYEVA